jgi:predicted O-linked N-acetylglucosamine transferase (SPINDLY family)
MATAGDELEQAVRSHQAGDLEAAERLYQAVLAVQPNHPDVLHLLGLVALQSGRLEQAVPWIQRAIAVRPDNPVYHCNLGEVFRAAGQTQEARRCYQQALAVQPKFVPAHYNLGLSHAEAEPATAEQYFARTAALDPTHVHALNDLGSVLRRLGQTDRALEAYRQALAVQPEFVDALSNLSVTLSELGRSEEALKYAERAVAVRPELAETQHVLGLARRAAGQLEFAAAAFQEAIRLRPEFPEALAELATVLRQQGDVPGAVKAYHALLKQRPHDVEALIDFGRLLQECDCAKESLEYIDRAISLAPNLAAAHFARAASLEKLRRPGDAVLELHHTLRCQPNYPGVHANLAAIYLLDGQPDEAVRYCQEGIAAGAISAGLYDNLSLALHNQARNTEAVEYCRKLVELAPDNAALHSQLLYELNFVPEQNPQGLFEEHLAWARRHAEPLTAEAAPHGNDRSPERRLRVGYVSPHFRQHAVNYFVEPILMAHDHEQFEVYCYSSVTQPDATTARLQAAADTWRDVCAETDEQLAQRVRDDQIDILVDLSGHMGKHRLLTFARKPAPIQVTYIGYQNTTGMSAMDYRLTDERSDPPRQSDRYYTEHLTRLPRAFYCYQPTPAPDVSPLPTLTNGWITFGSFNNTIKLTPAVFETWLELLTRVPNSRLIVLAYEGGYLERQLRDLARERGIDPARVELANRRSRDEYLKLIQRADIALDSFPSNGHTTTCDALWMGVPVVMLEGDTYCSRYGAPALAHVGLERLVAHSAAEYVEMATQLASDCDALAELRRGLRQRLTDSVLCDAAGFTRNLEEAYREMWRAWCAGHSPTGEAEPS